MSCWLPTVAEVVEIHDLVMEPDGGLAGVKDQGRLEAAASGPRASFGGQDLHPDPIAKACALMLYIASGHAFNDGNKRAAVACLCLVLERNGWVLLASDDVLYEIALGAADGSLSREDIDGRLRPFCRLRLD